MMHDICRQTQKTSTGRSNCMLEVALNKKKKKKKKNCKIAKLEVRRIAHLSMFMFKQKDNELIVNRRNINTRAHDASRPVAQ